MPTKHFLLYADAKTVKELDPKTATKMAFHKKRFLLVAIDEDGLYVQRGQNFIYVPLVQLRKVLKEEAQKK